MEEHIIDWQKEHLHRKLKAGFEEDRDRPPPDIKLDRVTRDGKIHLIFNQKLLVPPFVKK